MNLDLSPDELAFREEVRAWLAANVPTTPLPSMDTEAGFKAHQEWEPSSLPSGSRSCPGRASRRPRGSLIEWVIFEEEYYRAARPAGLAERHLPARPDHLRARHPRAAGPLPAVDGDR